ncbi:MAG: hypothetical protein II157_02505 [Bacteroidales bacterium]|nr:hypothetical protein [Bacteroidales bacterium]
MKCFFYTLILLAVCQSKAYSQSFEELPLDKQNTFFEGYWKSVSSNSDTIFILKIKHFETERGNVYIGSYLLKYNETLDDKLSDLSDFLPFSSFEDFKRIDSIKFYQNKVKQWYSIFLTGGTSHVMRGSFYDYIKGHRNGQVTLEVLSAQNGSETITWSLTIGDGTYYYPNGCENELFTFSVPTSTVFTKIYNLREFEDIGIILPPFPKKMELNPKV